MGARAVCPGREGVIAMGKSALRTRLAVLALALGVLGTSLLPAFAADGQLICQLPEHTHTEACYETAPICTEPEHAHDGICFDETGQCCCMLPEHLHTQECLDEQGQQQCGLEEHMHGVNGCQDADGDGWCDTAAHMHTEACFERQLVCTLAVHTHTENCFAAEQPGNGEEPEAPGQPENPEEPAEPEEPTDPEKPGDPENPEQPENPGEPDPEPPAEPENPEQPGAPEEPEPAPPEDSVQPGEELDPEEEAESEPKEEPEESEESEEAMLAAAQSASYTGSVSGGYFRAVRTTNGKEGIIQVPFVRLGTQGTETYIVQHGTSGSLDGMASILWSIWETLDDADRQALTVYEENTTPYENSVNASYFLRSYMGKDYQTARSVYCALYEKYRVQSQTLTDNTLAMLCYIFPTVEIYYKAYGSEDYTSLKNQADIDAVFDYRSLRVRNANGYAWLDIYQPITQTMLKLRIADTGIYLPALGSGKNGCLRVDIAQGAGGKLPEPHNLDLQLDFSRVTPAGVVFERVEKYGSDMGTGDVLCQTGDMDDYSCPWHWRIYLRGDPTGYALPTTGGRGTNGLRAGGAVLLSASCALGCCWRQRKRKQETERNEE